MVEGAATTSLVGIVDCPSTPDVHLEKAESIIWPSLIIGPVPESVSPPPAGVYPWLLDNAVELRYNMDPTSLVLIALDLYDIRKAEEDAFEYFVYVMLPFPALSPRLTSPTLFSQSGLAPSTAPLRSNPPRNPLPAAHDHCSRRIRRCIGGHHTP